MSPTIQSSLVQLYRASLRASKQIPNINVSQYVQRKLKYDYRQPTIIPITQTLTKATQGYEQIVKYKDISKMFWQPDYYESIIRK